MIHKNTKKYRIW